MRYAFIAVICSLSAITGCALHFDLDSVPLQTPDGGDGDSSDAGDVGDAGDASIDMSGADVSDAADVGDAAGAADATDATGDDDASDMVETTDVADAAEDLPTGMTCTNQPGALGGECDPVLQDCADSQQVCVVAVESVVSCPMGGTCPDSGRPCQSSEMCVTFTSGCQTPQVQESHELNEGEACLPNSDVKCRPGLFCRSGTCVRYCHLADATGCAAGQFCARHTADLDGVGFCTGDCADGQ